MQLAPSTAGLRSGRQRDMTTTIALWSFSTLPQVRSSQQADKSMNRGSVQLFLVSSRQLRQKTYPANTAVAGLFCALSDSANSLPVLTMLPFEGQRLSALATDRAGVQSTGVSCNRLQYDLSYSYPAVNNPRKNACTTSVHHSRRGVNLHLTRLKLLIAQQRCVHHRRTNTIVPSSKFTTSKGRVGTSGRSTRGGGGV